MKRSLTPRRRSTKRLRLLIFLGTALVLTGFVVAAYATDVFEDSELDTIDARFAIRGDLDPPEDIAIVGIDDQSFRELGEQWPFPRTLHAQAIRELDADGARVIAYDVQFTEPSDVPADDEALADAIALAGNVILATTVVDDKGATNVFGGDDVLKSLHARAAHAGYATDSGRVVRRMSHTLERLETFPVATVERSTGEQVPADAFPEQAWIDYHSRENIPIIPFYRVARGDFKPGTFTGKIVVVGAAAPSLQDVHPTSVSGAEFMYGVEIQANAISTLLEDFPLREAPGWITGALVLLFGAVGPLIAARFGPVRAALIGAALAGLYFVFVQLVFNAGVIIGLIYPLASLILGVDRRPRRGARARRLRARARARHLLALRAGGRGGRRAEERRRGPAPGRRATRGDRALQRHPRLHHVLGEPAAGGGDRGPQPLPDHDDRHHPPQRRNARVVHGRRHHGGVRRADRHG